MRPHAGQALISLFSTRIETPLDGPAVIERVRGLLRPEPSCGRILREGFGWRAPGTPPFIGEVRDGEFLIRRDIRYRNSFLPRIRGRLRPAQGGACVQLDMQLHPAVFGLMLFWLASAGTLAGSMLVMYGPEQALLPAGMLFAGLLLVALGFYPEAITTRRMLQKYLEARSSSDCR